MIALAAISGLVGSALFSIDASPRTILEAAVAFGASAALLYYPELALALYVVVGDLKGDDRVASLLPFDLTLLLAGVVLAGIALNWLRRKPVAKLPLIFWLYIPLAVLMIASLAYTPVFEAGLDKVARFLTVTAIVILAPFFVLATPVAMKRFLIAYAALAFAICAYSLTFLGGQTRLATPSNFTIGLGHIACALIVLIWFCVLPRLSFLARLCVYPLLAVPFMALVGAGSRGPLIALALALVGSVFLFRWLFFDLAALGILGVAALPFVHLPDASLDYLSTLLHCRDISVLMSFRHELFEQGWKLLQQHPLLGVGIQGFRYDSPNAALYNWPHNIFLELACELGLPAMLFAIAIFAVALREAWRQLRDRISPHASLSLGAAALLFIGIVNATNTGDINSDRPTWLFATLVFVVGSFRKPQSLATPRPSTATSLQIAPRIAE